MVEPIFPAPERPDDQHRALGHVMVVLAATLFAVNGTVSKVALASGISAERLSQMRSTGAFAGLALALLVVRPRALRVTRRDLPFLVVFGVGGLAFVQWFYFLAIDRLAIGVALLIEYLAPLLVALWARFVYREAVRRRLWVALALSLAGLTLIVEVWDADQIDTVGVTFALVGAVAFAAYVLLAEHGVRRRDSMSLGAYGFLFAAAFWAVLQPWWSFPAGAVAADVSLQGRLDIFSVPAWTLVVTIVLIGTIVPFALVIGALRHISATRLGIVAMLEPVVAIVVAWIWLEEALSPVQLIGAAVVLAAIGLAQTAR